jgi:hypothetical protein
MGSPELEGMAQAVGEAFAREHAVIAGEIATLTATARAAQETASAAVARAAELSAQLATHDETCAVMRSAITEVEHRQAGSAEPVNLAVDGWRLILRCVNGRELEVELPRPDLDAIAVLVVERHLAKLKGDKGDDGDEGAAAVVDLHELAGILRAEPEFVASVRGERGEQGLPGAPAAPWVAGVHRQGVRCSHYLGRVYEASVDTNDEPGDSAQWRRLDTTGMRHIGPREPAEAGDLHTKEGATFLFDGAQSWMLSAKAFTTSDGERLINPLSSQVKGLRDRIAATEQRAYGLAESARAANANAGEALRWITERAEAIDSLLGGA